MVSDIVCGVKNGRWWLVAEAPHTKPVHSVVVVRDTATARVKVRDVRVHSVRTRRPVVRAAPLIVILTIRPIAAAC